MKIEVWGTGRPLTGFTEDAVLISARKVFPTKKSQHIARFIAGKRFLIARVNDEASAQKLIEGLAKSGIEADTMGPLPVVGEAQEPEEIEDAEPQLDEVDETAPAAPEKPSRALGLGGKIAGAAIVLVLGGAGVTAFMMHRSHESTLDAAAQAIADAKAKASLAARREAEADAKKKAADAAAEKAEAAAQEALRVEKKEAAVGDMTSTFANGDYPQVIAMAERFDLMYGPDKRVIKLEQDATYTLKEGARRGNFAAILDAPIKGSPRYDALKRWAEEVQERAKPQH